MVVSTGRRNSEEIANKIREFIIMNKMAPGTMLPSIENLAQIYNVSKGTIREALMSLASMGVVNVQQGKGTSVARPKMTDVFRSLSWRALVEGLNFGELMEARLAVETLTARLCAERATSDEIEKLLSIHSKLKAAIEAGEYDATSRLDAEFHLFIAKSSKNSLLAEFVNLLHELLTSVTEQEDPKENAHIKLQYHEKILHAIEERSSQRASELSAEYLETLSGITSKQDLVIYCDGLGTGSIGGSFYTLGQAISKIIGRSTRIKPDIYATGGGVDNVRLTQERRIVLAISQADIAMDAYSGKGDFKYPCSDLRTLCCLPNLELQICTLGSSSVKDIADLKGKEIAVGALGGASASVAQEVLRQYGLQPNIDYTPHMQPISTAVEMMRKGSVDAVFFLSIGQSNALVELGCHKPLSLLSIDGSVLDGLIQRHPYWSATSIEAYTYPGQAGEIKTIGIPTVIICHKDLPDNDAYSVTSAILENLNEVGGVVYPAKPFTAQIAASGIGVPHHPGAVRYFNENGSINQGLA